MHQQYAYYTLLGNTDQNIALPKGKLLKLATVRTARVRLYIAKKEALSFDTLLTIISQVLSVYKNVKNVD